MTAKLIMVLAVDGCWIVLLLFSSTDGKFKVSLHAINHCCDIALLTSLTKAVQVHVAMTHTLSNLTDGILISWTLVYFCVL